MIWTLMGWVALLLTPVVFLVEWIRSRHGGQRALSWGIYQTHWGHALANTMRYVAISFIAYLVLTFFLFIGNDITVKGGTAAEYRIETSSTTELRALNLDGTAVGRFFLGSGYAGDRRIITYLNMEDSGGIRYASVRADQSLIFERDDRTPEIKTDRWIGGNPFWLPFPVHYQTVHEFTVPTGSVVENFTVEP